MNFEEAYRQLEDKFRQRVDKDYKQWKFESIFLPNMAPKAPVDYILVAMEPSLNGWAQDIPDAHQKICKGFRNFCGVWLLHFPVSEYLCQEGETYYLTDLAQGAMATNSEGAGSKEKYEAWYPLLEDELGLVAKPDAKIISLGSKVGGFLSEKGCTDTPAPSPTIPVQAPDTSEGKYQGGGNSTRSLPRNSKPYLVIPGSRATPARRTTFPERSPRRNRGRNCCSTTR